jgi:hypothetical protein
LHRRAVHAQDIDGPRVEVLADFDRHRVIETFSV